jgi:hypothetical protein
VGLAGWESVGRRRLVVTGALAFATTTAVLLVYFVAPVRNARHLDGLRLALGLAVFVAALVHEVRAIVRSPQPILRAANAMALVIPIFVVVFAWTYLTMAKGSPHAFSQPLNRISALYFTVTVFSTVGFGDIVPVSDAARLTVTVQMVCDVLVIAAVVRLIFEAARGTFGTGDDRRHDPA